jgi:hypothetical protein
MAGSPHRFSALLDKNKPADYFCWCLIPATAGSGGPKFLGRIANRRGVTSSVLAHQLTSQASMRKTFGIERGYFLHNFDSGGLRYVFWASRIIRPASLLHRLSLNAPKRRSAQA